MTTQESMNQQVNEQEEIINETETTPTDTLEGDTLAEDGAVEGDSTDTLADSSIEGDIWRDKFLRLQAEFDNYRKRTIKEKMDLVQSGGSDVLKAILPVVDDVQRAVVAMEKSDDVVAIREGVALIAQKFQETLRQKGVVEIEALDKELDTDLHEAIARFPAGEEKSGKIIDVVQSGYMLGDKVLRFAKVVVGE